MSDYTQVFDALTRILRRHAKGLVTKTDTADNLYIEIAPSDAKKKPEFFGAVQIKKSYVSYHLMPIYSNPGLLEGVSTELTSKMQGKSCFNFKAKDAALLQELDSLTRICREAVK